MKKVIEFLRESKTEMTEHVTWTKYSELQNNSILVLIASLIFALVIGLVDFLFDQGLDWFYKSFQG
ncbi:MAG: preprotein translocase subunit SecE [Cytophagales bacterium]|nr:preprotein translocase subunit SecE [Bernardetiaceae bacterium]MDW8206005.1 preprotein translocase subunit SecE [Cytophagales bacterium]